MTGNTTTTSRALNAGDDEYPSLLRANYALGLLFVTYLLSFLDRQVLTLLVGPIREQFDSPTFSSACFKARLLL